MLLLKQSLYTHIILVNFAMNLCVCVCVVIEGIYTCKIAHCFKNPFVLMSVLCYSVCTHITLVILAITFCVYIHVLYMICTHVRLGTFATTLIVYVCVVVEVM